MQRTLMKMLVAISAIMGGSAAQAAPVDLTRQSDGFTYFNRPAADMGALHRELDACLAIIVPFARGAGTGSFGPVGGVAGSIISGGVVGSMDAAALENCMVVRGWRVVRLPDAEGAALSHLDRSVLAERLSAWVGADVPRGTVVRHWQNDAARPDTIVTSMPGVSYRPSLSLLTLPESAGGLPPPAPVGAPHNNRGILFRPAKTTDLAALPSDSAVLLVTLSNDDQHAKLLRLMRLGPDSKTPAWVVDARPYAINIAVPKAARGSVGSVVETRAYVVPPGRWALAGISDLLTLCMGAPFFEVRPGDVIHTGIIDFGAEGLPIVQDSKPALAHLAASPALQAKVRPASWRNGATFPCGGYQYALEYPDLPYEPTYVRAGAPMPSR